MYLALLWLWSRLSAVAPIGPLAWETLYAVGVALKRKKTKAKKKKKKKKKTKKNKKIKKLKGQKESMQV